VATLEELKAQLKAVERERFNLRRGLEVGDPAARARDNELRPQNIYLQEAVARAENAQNNTYTVRQIFADGWEIQDQTGRVVSRGRSPEDAVERARDNGARPEDLSRVQLPPPAAIQPQAPPGAWKIEREANTGLWLVTYNGRPMGRSEGVGTAIFLARDRTSQINDPVTGEGAGTIGLLTFEIETQLKSQIDSIQQQEQAALNATSNATADQGPATVSAGETVAQAQTARDDAANTQNPQAPVETPGRITGTATNAEEFQPTVDAGTAAQQRPISSTQSIPPPTSPTPISQAQTGQRPVAPRQTGVGNREDQASDFQGFGGTNQVQVLASRTARQVEPQDNILDQYSSYTYSISIYLMTPEDYRRLMTSGQRYLPGYLLLIQSAGIPTSSGIQAQPGVADVGEVPGQGPSLTQGRNQFFPLDYYLDDLEIKHFIAGKGSGLSHNVSEIRFKIFEPNGITLLPNLYRAVNQYVQQGGGNSPATDTGNGNYAAQNYLMVLRWYGYDAQGNLLPPPPSTSGPNRTDTNAILEKFIPFQFTNIKFRIANRITEYECQAVAPQNNINTAQGRGTVPYNVQLTATTLQNFFNGSVRFEDQQTQGQANTDQRESVPPNQGTSTAVAAPDPLLSTGLTQALNSFQDELKRLGEITTPDQYEIRISHPAIAEAKVVPPGPVDRPTKPNVKAQSAAEARDGDKQFVRNNAKTISVTAGTSIVQVIDLAVRSSTYVIDQQKKIVTRDREGREVQIQQRNPNNAFAWYFIGVQATPIGNQQDPKRGDYAYKITYEIAPYGVNQMKSDYFPQGRFRGVQKRYPYWFTGENTQVLSYEQEINHLYYLTVNSAQDPSTLPRGYRELERRIPSPNSAETNQGQRGNPFEPGANAADFLYSPTDFSRVRLSIVGDPAWIAQGEIWNGVRSLRLQGNQPTDEDDPYFSPFLADGTINYDAREALFEVAFNHPADYDIDTGVIQIQRPQ